MARTAYAWLLSRPGVTAPIVGASKVWQLEEAVGAAEVTLSVEEVGELESAYRPHPVLGHT
jgi:aryl-alcohol dehydrogenase (NADP+)